MGPEDVARTDGLQTPASAQREGGLMRRAPLFLYMHAFLKQPQSGV